MPPLALRLGVAACVAGACLIGVSRLDNAVAVFDFQADTNAAATFTERSYPEIAGVPGFQGVVEDARLWMPEDAAFRVVHGPRSIDPTPPSSLATYLDVLLMPRTRTDALSAPWVFCSGCTADSLGGEYEILADSGEGFRFARRRA